MGMWAAHGRRVLLQVPGHLRGNGLEQPVCIQKIAEESPWDSSLPGLQPKIQTYAIA